MVNSKKFFPSRVVGFGFLLLLCCCQSKSWYRKDFSRENKKKLAEQFLEGAANYYQGSVPEQFILEEGLSFDTLNPALWRERATPYLKRGFPVDAFHYYKKEVDLAPQLWQGWRGYLYLYFYRDYNRAIADFNATDTLTTITDYPQGQSVDYMRGLCYYGLNDNETALKYFTQYIDEVTRQKDESWVDVYAFLYRGLTYERLNKPELALKDFRTGSKYDTRLSDFYFHQVRLIREQPLFDESEVSRLIKKAKENFMSGYFHHRDYVEVHDQLYLEDIEKLEKEVAKN
jgi:tetratricopeptide (TPR) repeat protein